MRKYIYESHMGGFYASDKEYDMDTLYCDTCGDSDNYLGYAENIDEAWEILKDEADLFDDRVCKNCEHQDDYAYCSEYCKQYLELLGSYSVSHIMKFLCDNFEPTKKLHYVYLLSKPKNADDCILVNCKPRGYEFGKKHSIPQGKCISEEFVYFIAKNLLMLAEDADDDTLELVCEKECDDKIIHVYKCQENKKEGQWEDLANYCNGSWYCYVKENDLELLENEKEIREIIRKEI